MSPTTARAAPMTAGDVYMPSNAELLRWTKACDRLASDPDLCDRVAKTRDWKPETIHDLAVEGSLGTKTASRGFGAAASCPSRAGQRFSSPKAKATALRCWTMGPR